MNLFAQYSDRIIKPGLERLKSFLNKLGNPQNKFNTVLVGGTNGKGSTVAFLFHMLSALGLKTGGYLSPHLFNLEERVLLSVPGAKELPRIFEEMEKKSLDWKIELTPFELLTASIFVLFNNCGIDLAILEVGMGGRWDATNVTSPLVSIITSLGLDHTQFLGSTITTIAEEKFPIARQERPLILGNIPLTGLKVLREEGKSLETKTYEWGKDFFAIGRDRDFCYVGDHIVPHIALAMEGSHQWVNASLALKAVELLGLPVNGCVVEGLKRAWLPGRMQVEEVKGVSVVLDVAHNPLALGVLIGGLRKRFGNRPVWVFLRLLKDKPWREFLKVAQKAFEKVYFLEVARDDDRALSPTSALVEVGMEPRVFSFERQGKRILEKARKEEAVLVFTGSFGAVKEAMSWLNGLK